MKSCASLLLLVLGIAGAAETQKVRLNSHVINDEAQISELRRALQHASFSRSAVLSKPVSVYYIWYGNWNGNSGVTLLENFARNLGGSPYYNINTTYTDGEGNAVSNRLLFGGSTVDSYSLGKDLSDEQIWQSVQAAIAAGKVPSDPNGIYFLLTSADVNATSGFCKSYCGWHNHQTLNGTMIKYAFVGDAGRCPSACAAQTVISPNGNPGADAMASAVAHEVNRVVSGPESSDATAADTCAWTFGKTFTTANGSRANLTLGDYDYLIEQNWVNGGGCALEHVVPELNAISPARLPLGARVPVTLTGANFVAGAVVDVAGAGLTFSDIKVESATRIQAILAVADDAPVGTHNVTITQGAAVSAPVAFATRAAASSLTSVTPSQGVAGLMVPIALTGSNFTSAAAIKISGTGVTAGNLKVVSTTRITAELSIDANATPGDCAIAVVTGSATSEAIPFTIVAPPATLNSIAPTKGVIGNTIKVTLNGANFSAGNTLAITGSGVTVSGVTVVGTKQLTANLTIAPLAPAGARYITVSTGSATSGPVTFQIAGVTTLTSVSPTSATTGTTTKVTLTGTNFTTGVSVAISGSGVTATGVAATNGNQITANLIVDKTASPGPRFLTVGTTNGSTAGVIFTISPSLAITSITPASAAPGETVRLTLNGTNFTTGAKIAVSGGDVGVDGITVVSGTQITANFVVDPLATPGARNLTLSSGSLTSAPAIFTVNALPITVTATSPSATLAGNTVLVILTGTHFTKGAAVAVSGTGIAVSNVSVVNPTRITAQFAIDKTATVGAHTVSVSNGTTTSTSTTTFTINAIPGVPFLTQLDTVSAAVGTTFNITASGANFVSTNKLVFSGTGITVSNLKAVTANQITATVAIDAGAATGARSVTVTGGVGSSAALPFTITGQTIPSLTRLDLVTAAAGSTVNLIATGANFAVPDSLVFSGTGVSVSNLKIVSTSQITATATIDPAAPTGTRNVIVTSGAGSSAPLTFTITAPLVPSLTQLDVATAPAGSTVNLIATGANFASTNQLVFSGTGITVSNLKAVTVNQITAIVTIDPSAVTGARSVTVSGSAGSSSALTFTVTSPVPTGGPATISNVSPASGVLGIALTMTITGSGFTPSTIVLVADHEIPVLRVKYVSPTQLTVILGLSGAVGAHSLQVSRREASAIASAPASFAITAPPTPTITSATPATAALGKTVSVTLRGSNFTPDLAATISGTGVTVGSKVTAAGSAFATLTVSVAPDALPGPRTLTVHTAGGTSNAVAFNVSTR